MLNCIIIKVINLSIIIVKIKKGGCISLFIKDEITCIERNDHTTDFESFESLFIELNHLTTVHAKNGVIGVIYRPPNHDISEFIDHMSSVTDTLTRENKICYLMGDFNLDLFNHETPTLTGAQAPLTPSNLSALHRGRGSPVMSSSRPTTHSRTAVGGLYSTFD